MSSFSWPPQGSSGGGGGTQNVNLTEVNGAPVDTGPGTSGPGTQRVAVSSDSGPLTVQGEGTAGTPTGGLVTVQGSPSGTPIPVSFTPAGTQNVNLAQVNGATVTVGTGAASANTERVAVSSDSSLASVASITNPVTVAQATAANLNATVVQPTAANLNATVVGTVTANIGTSGALALNSTLLNVQGSASGGTAAADSNLVGGIFNSTPPTLTNGQQASLQFDANGNLKITASGSGSTSVTQGTTPWVDNVSQFGGNNVVTGTGASGLGIPRVTISNDSNVLATQSGTWNITNITGTVSLPTGASTSANQTNGSQKTQVVDGSGTVIGPAQTVSGSNYFPVVLAASATPGSPLVARSIQVAGSDGTNAQTLSVDTTGKLNVNNISGTISLPTGASTAALQSNVQSAPGTPQTVAVTVQGNAASVPIPVSVSSTTGTSNVNLIQVGGTSVALGQTVKASSFPVTIASDQATVSDGTNTAIVFPSGRLKVEQEATQLFDDTFVNGLDTSNNWNTPITTGTASVTTNVPGEVDLHTGTTANSYATTSSQNNFSQVAPGWLEIYHAINLSNATPTNAYLFWGIGTIPATPTASAPLTDAVGFEIATNGKMFAVCYSAGTRNVIQDLSSGSGNNKQPTDTAVHKYFIFFRGDLAYWYIDGLSASNLVATMLTGAPGPINNILPLRLLAIANSTPPGVSVTMSDNAAFVGDTARNNQQISDGSFPWIKATVKNPTTAASSADTSLVVALSPNSPVPAGTNAIGYMKDQGLSNANAPVYNVYSSTNITTSAYTQLIASTAANTNTVSIFDSSGQAMILAVGAMGSEVIQVYVPPGGNDFKLSILAGSRVAYKALTANATTGYLLLNLLG